LFPAFAIGKACLVIETIDVAVGQTPLPTLHKKPFVPTFIPDTKGAATVKLERVALPEKTDQKPEPKV